MGNGYLFFHKLIMWTHHHTQQILTEIEWKAAMRPLRWDVRVSELYRRVKDMSWSSAKRRAQGFSSSFTSLSLSLSLVTAVCTANNLNCESVEGQNITMNNYLLLPWGRLFTARHSKSPHCTAEKSKAAEHKTSKTFHKKSQHGVWRVIHGCLATWRLIAKAYSSSHEVVMKTL